MTGMISSVISPCAHSLHALQSYRAQGANDPAADLVGQVKNQTGIVTSHLAPLQGIAVITNSIIGVRARPNQIGKF